MKKLIITGMVILSLSACSRPNDGLQVPTGSDVAVERRDGVKVEGRLIEVRPDHVVLELRGGEKRNVPRADIAKLHAVTVGETPANGDAAPTTGDKANASPSTTSEPAKGPTAESAAADPAPKPPVYRDVTIPAGTVLKMTLNTAVASDSSHVEDPVRATLRTPVTIGGVQALPSGTVVTGHVTDVARAGKVKGRARVAFRFTRLDPPGDGEAMRIRTTSASHLAPATKKRDAATIGGGAVGGAIIGGIVGGGDGAAKGAAIGGAGGTGVVLATRGQEVRLAAGTPVSVRLNAPLTVRVPAR